MGEVWFGLAEVLKRSYLAGVRCSHGWAAEGQNCSHSSLEVASVVKVDVRRIVNLWEEVEGVFRIVVLRT